ncbi:MAG: Npt1/Npt2 family nucleotide transporter [Chlamydiota bacterium]
MFKKIKELLGIDFFILCAMACGFFISADYSIVRPVSNSLFIHFYGSEYLPYAWLIGLPFSFFAVSLYNRYLGKLGCAKMFAFTASFIVIVNLITALFVNQAEWLSFFFYVWKEVYIMLMFQQLWSVIHSTVNKEKAKFLYGLLFGFGALGGVFGSFIPGFFAVKLSSETLIFATLPIYLLLSISFALLLKHAKTVTFEKKGEFLQGVKLIITSRALLFILAIVVLMQFCSTLIDYQFQHGLQLSIPDKDLRTEYAGRLFSIIHGATLCLQFLGTYLLIQILGLRTSHFLVPFLLAASNMGYLLFPLFGMISFSYILIKSFDFSFFVIVKEMLYIPMKSEEKFHAKAVIDVFAYRSAKALASCLILFINPNFLTWANISLFVIWCIIVIKYFREKVPAYEKT